MSTNNSVYGKKAYTPRKFESKLENTTDKDVMISQLKAHIFELEQNEKNYELLTQKFRNLQNE